jgi:hypothetical protein
MALTREEIIKQREEIEDEISRLKGLVKVEQAKLSALQSRCKHPNMHKYSAMGETGYYCPDCHSDS